MPARPTPLPDHMTTPWLTPDPKHPGRWLLRLKVVPGSSRDQIVGPLGDRLKVKVAAPPEGGKANKSVCKMIAMLLDIAPVQISILSGETLPDKLIGITGVSPDSLNKLLTVNS